MTKETKLLNVAQELQHFRRLVAEVDARQAEALRAHDRRLSEMAEAGQRHSAEMSRIADEGQRRVQSAIDVGVAEGERRIKEISDEIYQRIAPIEAALSVEGGDADAAPPMLIEDRSAEMQVDDDRIAALEARVSSLQAQVDAATRPATMEGRDDRIAMGSGFQVGLVFLRLRQGEILFEAVIEEMRDRGIQISETLIDDALAAAAQDQDVRESKGLMREWLMRSLAQELIMRDVAAAAQIDPMRFAEMEAEAKRQAAEAEDEDLSAAS